MKANVSEETGVVVCHGGGEDGREIAEFLNTFLAWPVVWNPGTQPFQLEVVGVMDVVPDVIREARGYLRDFFGMVEEGHTYSSRESFETSNVGRN